jgi:hypothetical protein
MRRGSALRVEACCNSLWAMSRKIQIAWQVVLVVVQSRQKAGDRQEPIC